MSFQSQQKKRLAQYALERYGVTGHVLPYELVSEMLHESYRERTLAYFAKHRIKWWSSRYDVGRPALAADDIGAPTGHLNSSQVAAVNHLEPARLDATLARQVLARSVISSSHLEGTLSGSPSFLRAGPCRPARLSHQASR